MTARCCSTISLWSRTCAGAQMTNVRVWLFEVEYSILVLPCREGEIDGQDWAGEILGLYRQMLTPQGYARNVRLIRG